ncbi:hypothetical protein BDZ97DRAFT_1761867 [Flammula alnicola]|nr:hypothetical protein BDZ97DRAFT_1761867 [Flammula alnicola]
MPRTAYSITAHYTECSLALNIRGIPGHTTLGAIRSQVVSDLTRHIQISHSSSEALDLNPSSVVIASDSVGFRRYDDDNIFLEDVADDEDGIHAIVPSKQNQRSIDIGVPTEGIADYPHYLTDPLMFSWDTRLAAVTSAIQAAISPVYVELSALKEELKKEKELRAVAESDYQRMLDEEKAERIEQIADAQAYTKAVEEFVIHQVLIPTNGTTKDTTYLNTIRLRAALDYTQATIARTTGLSTPKSTSASWEFRRKLDKAGDSTEERVKLAKKFITNAKLSLPHMAELLDSDAAMSLICEKESSIRKRGNTIAHLSPSTEEELSSLTAAVDELQTTLEQNGMRDITRFLKDVNVGINNLHATPDVVHNDHTPPTTLSAHPPPHTILNAVLMSLSLPSSLSQSLLRCFLRLILSRHRLRQVKSASSSINSSVSVNANDSVSVNANDNVSPQIPTSAEAGYISVSPPETTFALAAAPPTQVGCRITIEAPIRHHHGDLLTQQPPPPFKQQHQTCQHHHWRRPSSALPREADEDVEMRLGARVEEDGHGHKERTYLLPKLLLHLSLSKQNLHQWKRQNHHQHSQPQPQRSAICIDVIRSSPSPSWASSPLSPPPQSLMLLSPVAGPPPPPPLIYTYIRISILTASCFALISILAFLSSITCSSAYVQAALTKASLSLRDLVLRRKKQHEEMEMELSKSVQASPLSVSSTFGLEGEGDGGVDVGVVRMVGMGMGWGTRRRRMEWMFGRRHVSHAPTSAPPPRSQTHLPVNIQEDSEISPPRRVHRAPAAAACDGCVACDGLIVSWSCVWFGAWSWSWFWRRCWDNGKTKLQPSWPVQLAAQHVQQRLQHALPRTPSPSRARRPQDPASTPPLPLPLHLPPSLPVCRSAALYPDPLPASESGTCPGTTLRTGACLETPMPTSTQLQTQSIHLLLAHHMLYANRYPTSQSRGGSPPHSISSFLHAHPHEGGGGSQYIPNESRKGAGEGSGKRVCNTG